MSYQQNKLFDSFLRKLFVVVSLIRQKRTPSVKPVPSVFYTSFYPWNKKVHNMQRNVSSSLNSAVPYILSVFRHFLSKKNTFAWYQTLSVICSKIVFKVLECHKVSKKAYDCVFLKPKPVMNTQ